MFGYHGKILHIYLTERKHWVEEKTVQNLYWRRIHGQPLMLGKHHPRL